MSKKFRTNILSSSSANSRNLTQFMSPHITYEKRNSFDVRHPLVLLSKSICEVW